jgi:hypothetical protein
MATFIGAAAYGPRQRQPQERSSSGFAGIAVVDGYIPIKSTHNLRGTSACAQVADFGGLVSTDGRTLDAQQSSLTAAAAERVFAEKVSGAFTIVRP